jgi:DNA-directed RNA polymerase subunit RPC12/RpoP
VIADLERDALEINVPTASAPVPAAAEVTCVTCARRIPLARADVVGLGFRCTDCSLRAELGELTGKPDVAAHLQTEDRARFAAQGRAIAIRAGAIAGGMTLLAIGLVAIAPDLFMAAYKLVVTAIIVALGVGGMGLERWRRFRG